MAKNYKYKLLNTGGCKKWKQLVENESKVVKVSIVCSSALNLAPLCHIKFKISSNEVSCAAAAGGGPVVAANTSSDGGAVGGASAENKPAKSPKLRSSCLLSCWGKLDAESISPKMSSPKTPLDSGALADWRATRIQRIWIQMLQGCALTVIPKSSPKKSWEEGVAPIIKSSSSCRSLSTKRSMSPAQKESATQ